MIYYNKLICQSNFTVITKIAIFYTNKKICEILLCFSNLIDDNSFI